MGYKGADLNSNSASFTFVHVLCTKKKKSVFYLIIKKVLKAKSYHEVTGREHRVQEGLWGGRGKRGRGWEPRKKRAGHSEAFPSPPVATRCLKRGPGKMTVGVIHAPDFQDSTNRRMGNNSIALKY